MTILSDYQNKINQHASNAIAPDMLDFLSQFPASMDYFIKNLAAHSTNKDKACALLGAFMVLEEAKQHETLLPESTSYITELQNAVARLLHGMTDPLGTCLGG